VVFCRLALCWLSLSVAPLLTTESIFMCGWGGVPASGVTDIGAAPDTVAGFSNGMGLVTVVLDVVCAAGS
jgi:hypothetical protein